MGFGDRIMAAYSALTQKQPQGKAADYPYFYNFSASILGTPSSNAQLNHDMLRKFSESPIVYRAISYIRNQVTRLAWDIQPKDGKKLSAAQKKQIEIAKNVLRYPNADDNFSSWTGQLVEDMLVIGMGTSEVKEFKGNPEQPYLLYPIDAASVSIYVDWDGNPTKPRYCQFDIHNQRVEFTNKEVLVMKHNPRSATPFGLSPVEVSVQQIQYLLDAQSYAGKTASNATPKKLLYLGQDLTEKQIIEFRQYFRDEVEGRSHLPIVGGTNDVKSIELGLNTDHNLFLQWQTFLIAIIANAFNLDIMKFNAIVGINRSTGDGLDDSSDESAIRPMAMTIEHYINQHLLSIMGIADFAEFKYQFTTSFSDRKALAVIHQIYGQLDALTINEMRREQGLIDLPYDEMLGHSKGDLTVSEYRAVFGGQVNLGDAVGVDEDTKTTNPDSLEGQEKANQAQNGTNDPNNNGGQNGVHGSPQPKEKAVNKPDDMKATL